MQVLVLVRCIILIIKLFYNLYIIYFTFAHPYLHLDPSHDICYDRQSYFHVLYCHIDNPGFFYFNCTSLLTLHDNGHSNTELDAVTETGEWLNKWKWTYFTWMEKDGSCTCLFKHLKLKGRVQNRRLRGSQREVTDWLGYMNCLTITKRETGASIWHVIPAHLSVGLLFQWKPGNHTGEPIFHRCCSLSVWHMDTVICGELDDHSNLTW